MAKIYSQLEKAQLENTTSDTSSHPKGMITYRTDLNVAKVSDGTSYKEIVDTSTAQTLTTKTLTSPTIGGASTFVQQASAPSNPSVGNNKLYYKTDGLLYTLDSSGNEVPVGSGSGGGVVNLITNGSADSVSSSIFVPYADAAATRPVDGTGGSPTVTTSITSTNPINGTKSFLLTKTAANSQGQGWAVPFTVDNLYKAKVLKISVDCIVNSGTFVAGDATTDSDVIWYLYDVTNSALIEPVPFRMVSNSSSLVNTFEGFFQTSATGTSYRLIAHVATTSAAAYALKVDNITVTPAISVLAKNSTAARYKTATTGSYANSSTTIIDFSTKDFDLAGSVTTGASWKYTAIYSGVFRVSTSILTDTNTNTGDIELLLYKNGSALVSLSLDDADSADIAKRYGVRGTTTVQLVAGDFIDVRLTNRSGATRSLIASDLANYIEISAVDAVPNTDGAARVVAARTRFTSLVSTTANQPIAYNTVDYDLTGSMSAGRFTAPVSGVYQISGTGRTGSGSPTGNYYFAVDGTLHTYLVNAAALIIQPLSGQVYLRAGQILDIRFDQTAQHALEGAFGVNLISGPNQIAPSAEINARYTNTAGTSVGTSDTLIPFATRSYDSHSAWSGNAFVCPVAGRYSVIAKVSIANTNLSTTQAYTFSLYKNGSFYSELGQSIGNGQSISWRPSGSDDVNCAAGDTLQIYAASSVATTLLTIAGYNYVSIKKVG